MISYPNGTFLEEPENCDDCGEEIYYPHSQYLEMREPDAEGHVDICSAPETEPIPEPEKDDGWEWGFILIGHHQRDQTLFIPWPRES